MREWRLILSGVILCPTKRLEISTFKASEFADNTFGGENPHKNAELIMSDSSIDYM